MFQQKKKAHKKHPVPIYTVVIHPDAVIVHNSKVNVIHDEGEEVEARVNIYEGAFYWKGDYYHNTPILLWGGTMSEFKTALTLAKGIKKLGNST